MSVVGSIGDVGVSDAGSHRVDTMPDGTTAVYSVADVELAVPDEHGMRELLTLVVAAREAEAERVGRLHGHPDVVWCGRVKHFVRLSERLSDSGSPADEQVACAKSIAALALGWLESLRARGHA